MARWLSKKLRIQNMMAREVLAEFLGTFILMVAQKVLSSGTVGTSLSIQWSWGIGVMMGIFVAGGVSDALDNFDKGVRMTEGPLATAGIWATYPQSYVSIQETFGDQVFGTALLLICVMAITDERNMAVPKGLVPIAIGLVVVVIGMTHRSYLYFWVPVIGPHLGAIIGCLVYLLFVGLHWPEVYDVFQDDPKTPEDTQAHNNGVIGKQLHSIIILKDILIIECTICTF
ncbi:hypothetical protein FSP39_014074 [Pinctada imbricata]|uniref:Uncharacterized protein n=1 Tax=Pinctada imbricata TaxID=66713 RepID=A0AA88Y4K0_PINIB|nr:hypothetical protein FSP39_014074 [Pinctada imbricata]